MKPLPGFLAAIYLFCSCSTKSTADLLIYNATIYTVDSNFSVAEAMAIQNGKIIAVGNSDSLRNVFQPGESLDVKGAFVYPGFIDAHTHFFRYALGLQTLDLTGTESWAQVIEKLKNFAEQNTNGWLIGRGWDQNDWKEKEFPTKEELDKLFPDRPVFLTRVDGHAAIANQEALDIGQVKAGDRTEGGIIETKNGRLTGILIDNAVSRVGAKIPDPGRNEIQSALALGQNNCFAVGLTTVDDCGLDYPEVQLIDSLQNAGILKMRVYAMLSDNPVNYNYLFSKGKIKTNRLNVRSFKVYADGALGSRGACLLEPYHDRPRESGFLLRTLRHYDSVANLLSQKGYQMCTHAIGDSANRALLNIYAKYLKGKNNLRWRIEHAQVVDPGDLPLYGENNIISSVQPTHATSDMYWAADRLGPLRIRGAYAYRELLKQNGWITLGTDFPVEDISPFKTFFAASAREDARGWPRGGFQPENALTPEETLKGMTIWAARSNFEEHEKGSLEKGKFADFVILNQDLLKTRGTTILNTVVQATFVNGEKVYFKR